MVVTCCDWSGSKSRHDTWHSLIGLSHWYKSFTPSFDIIRKLRVVPEQLMSVELSTNMEDESPTRYMLSEGSVCLPKQEKEEDAMIDYSYNPYSPPKYPTVGQKKKEGTQERESRKETKGHEDQAGIRHQRSEGTQRSCTLALCI